MAFASNSGGGAMSDINVTPLVDVLLVLLIIFMVTMPTQTYPIKLDLPQATNNPPPPPKKLPIKLKIDAAGMVFWNDTPVDMKALEAQMKDTVAEDPTDTPLLQIETANDTPYDAFAKVLAAAKNADMEKIGFVQN